MLFLRGMLPTLLFVSSLLLDSLPSLHVSLCDVSIAILNGACAQRLPACAPPPVWHCHMTSTVHRRIVELYLESPAPSGSCALGRNRCRSPCCLLCTEMMPQLRRVVPRCGWTGQRCRLGFQVRPSQCLCGSSSHDDGGSTSSRMSFVSCAMLVLAATRKAEKPPLCSG